MYGTVEWVKRLCDVGLWTVEGDGYRDTRYFPLNPSSAVIEKRKADAAERQRRKRRNDEQPRESRVTTGGTTRVTKTPRAPRPPSGGSVGAREATPPKPHPFAEEQPGWCKCGLPRRNKAHPAA
jgi:hypothetical protein